MNIKIEDFKRDIERLDVEIKSALTGGGVIQQIISSADSFNQDELNTAMAEARSKTTTVGELSAAYRPKFHKLLLQAAKSENWPEIAEHIAFLLWAGGIQEANQTLIVAMLNKSAGIINLAESKVKYQDIQLTAQMQALVTVANQLTGIKGAATQRAKNAADARHSKPGGSHDLAKKICAVWASGKYANRDICADQEYEAIGYKSFKTARNALKGTPNPYPWPGKSNK